MKFFIVAIIIFLTAFSYTVIAQTFPQDFDFSPRTEALLDAGALWDINSLYHPLICIRPDTAVRESKELNAFKWLDDYLSDYMEYANQPTDTSRIGLNVLFATGLGLNYQSGAARSFDDVAFQPYVWLQMKFREHWYSRIYARATNYKESLPHFSGVPRDVSRLGLNTGEIDQSIIGYRDKWVNIEYGRTREIWGPMVEDNLVLAGEVPAYERLMAQLSLGRFTMRYFFGFLETCYENGEYINRYISGRSIQYSNRRNLIIGISEASVLAGVDRPIDLAFLNPLSLHIETDLNDRSTSGEINHNNAIWSLDLDWLPLNNLRFSGTFSIDEIKLDRTEQDKKEPNVLGYFTRLAWTPNRKTIGITLIAEWIRLDTYFFQHGYNYANFVDRDQLFGPPIGNDADQISATVRMVFRYPVMAEIEFGRRRWGDNSIINNPYMTFNEVTKGSFPSGEKRENRYLALRLNSQPLRCLSFSLDGQIDLSHHGDESSLEKYDFIVRYQLPLTLIKL